MPTLLRLGRWAVRIYAPPREHPPPHVHVLLRGVGQVIIRLGAGPRAPKVWAVFGMTEAEVLTAYRLVEEHHARLVTAWEVLHGSPTSD